MDRKEQLLKLVEDKQEIVIELVDDIVFLENQLDHLKKYPFIRINPDNPELQKATPAAKQYKELLQQYSNCIKLFGTFCKDGGSDQDSPLREWFRKRNGGG